VGYVPGQGTYDCDAQHVLASIVTWSDAGNRQDNLALACNQPVTLSADPGAPFNSAQCHIIYGCQSE